MIIRIGDTRLEYKTVLKFLYKNKLISTSGRVVNRPSTYTNNKGLEIELKELTTFLPNTATNKERIVNLLANNLKECVKCVSCGSPAKFNPNKNVYYATCGDSDCKHQTTSDKHPLQIESISVDEEVLEQAISEVDDDIRGEQIECRVCGEYMNMITNTHLKRHDMTLDEYMKEFPEASTISKKTQATQSKKATLVQSARRGVARPDEVKQKISATKRNNPTPAHNKGTSKTEEEKQHLSRLALERFKDISKHPQYGAVRSEEERQNISTKMKAVHAERSEVEKKEIALKRKETMATKVENGWKYALQRPDSKQKYVDTMIARYGVTTPFESEEILKRRNETMVERYGDINAMRNESIKDKQRHTVKERYGRDNVTSSLKGWIRQRRGYGTNSHLTDAELTKIFHKINDVDWIIQQHHDLKKPITQIANELGLEDNQYHAISRVMKQNNIKIKNHFLSVGQQEVTDFVRTMITDSEILVNDRTTLSGNRELDIYLPEYNVAIEYNGLYWHSSRDVNEDRSFRNRHIDKTKECEELGIQLIHIFENDWINSRNIVESRLSNLLGGSKRIYARKCELVQVTFKEAQQFCNDNHLQGHATFSTGFGLKFRGELVSLMTFSKSRYDKNFDWELIRFVNKLGTTVVGGASRLLKHFRKLHPTDSIISYAAASWSSGNLYKQLGFEYAGRTEPNYYYFRKQDGIELQSRIHFQKHKLANKLDIFDDSLTEAQNMYNNGYSRIWDCGNTRWVIQKLN